MPANRTGGQGQRWAKNGPSDLDCPMDLFSEEAVVTGAIRRVQRRLHVRSAGLVQADRHVHDRRGPARTHVGERDRNPVRPPARREPLSAACRWEIRVSKRGEMHGRSVHIAVDLDEEMSGLSGEAHVHLPAARAPNGIRTRAAALKGRCPRPLDDGGVVGFGRRRRHQPAVGTAPA